MIFIPTVMRLKISVLKYAYFAYTMYGVAITPALLAALAWKRATRAGGLASIVSGVVMTVILDIIIPAVFPSVMVSGDPWEYRASIPLWQSRSGCSCLSVT